MHENCEQRESLSFSTKPVERTSEIIEYSPFTFNKLILISTMESLVRFLIGFVLIYQLGPPADCKVIKQQPQQDEHGQEIKVNLERQPNGTTHFNSTLNGSRVEVDGTSIKYTNSTLLSSGSNINSLTQM